MEEAANRYEVEASTLEHVGHLRIELVRGRRGGCLRWAPLELDLGPNEFELLVTLTTHSRQGFISWREIARVVTFQSIQPNSENVRELVHRLRRKLATIGIRESIEGRQRCGYRLVGDLGDLDTIVHP